MGRVRGERSMPPKVISDIRVRQNGNLGVTQTLEHI